MRQSDIELRNRTFEEVASDPEASVYYYSEHDGVQILVARGPMSLCSYYGVLLRGRPRNMPGYEELNASVHGGFTFGGSWVKWKGAPKEFWRCVDGYFWYGWDYAHYGDKSFWPSGEKDAILKTLGKGHDYPDGGRGYPWTPADVTEQAIQRVPEFKKELSKFLKKKKKSK